MVECRLLLVQPSRLLREGLCLVLHGIGCAIQDVPSVQAFLKEENLVRPDLIIWAGVPPKVLSAEIATVRARFGQAPAPVKHIVIGHELEAKYIRQISILDVEALLQDDITGEVLLRSIELVMLGQRLFPVLRSRDRPKTVAEIVPFPGTQLFAEKVVSRPQQREVVLSHRESEILRFLVDGASNKAIALELQITEATVKVHVRALLRKVHATNRTQAATWALQNRYGNVNISTLPLRVADG